ncbi:MAG: hypothetical protein U0572_06165 [Phycisphaerales bacterium]
MDLRSELRATWMAAMIGCAASVALGQTAPTPPSAPEKQADVQKKPEAPAKDAPKSLDDVLGIPGGSAGDRDAAKGANDAVPALDKAHDRVEKALDEKALEDLMRQALGGMRVSADRLSKETDYGLGTQRVQQDVIAKLDTLIDEAKKRCKKGQCKSQSSGQCNNPQPSDSQCNKPGDSKSKAQEAKKPGSSRGATAAGAEPAPVDPTDHNVVFDESRAEWGKLPERVRELIRQGSRDRIASLYQRMTEEYYRRMAEDASK